MATTFVEYTGDGQASKQFTFPSLQESDVKVRVDGVLKTTSTHYNITGYTTTGGGNVVFTSGNIPSSPANIRIYRDTNVDTAKATFTAGSSVKAADLNNNTTQLLYRAQEEQSPNLIHTYDIDTNAIETSNIKADAVTGAKIADDQINSEHYVDGSIDTAHIADGQITSAKIADGTIVNADINASAAIDGSKIAASTTSAAGSMSSADKAKLDGIETGATADQTNAEIRAAVEAASDSNVFTDADHSKLNGIEAGATADQTISEIKSLIAGSPLDASHLAANSVGSSEIASNAVTTDKIADSELSTLAGMQSGTASILASGTTLTTSITELNQLSGITLETSVSTNSNVRIPTSKAVNDQILAVTNALGGFVAIADETSFPTANPDPSNGAGTVVSISQVSSGSAITINSSGVATIANGAGTGNTVTITGFPTTLRNTSLAASSGLQVQTTSTLHTYTFHKQLASAADIAAISATVNSFSNRYRVSSSQPLDSLDGGDLWYDTTNSKLMVYSSANSAWEEATAIGNFFISTISSSSNSGGGSATPNGTATRFTISDAPTSAAQLIVSVDGVIQKPNSGSSAPSEGFVLVGNDIIFGAAPANGASLFVTVIGSTVGIGTPSNNTVTSAILQNGSVVTDKIADEAVTLAKLPHGTSSNNGKFLRANNGADPSFETVDLTTKFTNAGGDTITGDFTIASGVTNKNINIDVSDKVRFDDNLKATFGNGDDLQIFHDGTHTRIYNDTATSLNFTSPDFTFNSASNSNQLARFTNNGSCELYHSGTKRLETTSSGASVTGNFGMSGSFTGNLVPDSDSSRNLGANATRWANAYVDTYYGDGSNLTGINTDLVSDTTPQLGGNLASNGNSIQLADGDRVQFGASNDLQIYHTGSFNLIHASNGYLQTRASALYINNEGNSNNFIRCENVSGNDLVSLHYNGSKKFETSSGGATITGTLSTSGTGNVNISNGAGAITVNSGGDIRLNNASWTGDYAGKIQHANDFLYFQGGTGTYAFIFRDPGGANRLYIDENGHVIPADNNSYDLGSSSKRWRDLYTNDLNLSNEGSSNDVDGTWGDWTIQEGESDLFLKNNRSGKKYKFNLTEVS